MKKLFVLLLLVAMQSKAMESSEELPPLRVTVDFVSRDNNWSEENIIRFRAENWEELELLRLNYCDYGAEKVEKQITKMINESEQIGQFAEAGISQLLSTLRCDILKMVGESDENKKLIDQAVSQQQKKLLKERLLDLLSSKMMSLLKPEFTRSSMAYKLYRQNNKQQK